MMQISGYLPILLGQSMRSVYKNFKGKTFLLLFIFCATHIHAQEFMHQFMLNSSVFYSGTVNGNGIFVSDTNHIYFVTARHNVFTEKPPYKLIQREATLSFYSNSVFSDTASIINMNLKDAYEKGYIKYDSMNDIAIVAIASFKRNVAPSGKPEYYPFIAKSETAYVPTWLYEWSEMYKDVEVGGSVYLFGYPLSLGLKQMQQYDYQHPLLRKGDVSGKFDKHKSIIVYGRVNTGNTGGPVFETKQTSKGEKIRLIGIATGAIPDINQAGAQNLNSDYSVVVPMDDVGELMRQFRKTN